MKYFEPKKTPEEFLAEVIEDVEKAAALEYGEHTDGSDPWSLRCYVHVREPQPGYTGKHRIKMPF